MRSRLSGPLLGIAAALTACVLSPLAGARIIAIDIDLPIDQVAAEQPGIKIGDHHRARVFYDTAKVDRKTGRVKPLHMQHMMGGQWVPLRLDALQMPMDDSWLEIHGKDLSYHYHSAVVEGGQPVVIDFDGPSHRMSIRRQSDNLVLVSAPMLIDPQPVTDANAFTLTAAPPVYVMHNVSMVLDQVAPSQAKNFKVGGIDRLRVVYDASLIDPKSRRVHLLNMQHFIGGHYNPERADPVVMPMNDAWLELRGRPYRLHYHAAVTHGAPVIIHADEHTQRLSVVSQDESKEVMISGKYTVDPAPLSGPDAVLAATRAPAPAPASHAADAKP
jgi:hypothetical protein